MSLSCLEIVEDLITRFGTNTNNKITIVSRVVKTEQFGDDYHDFDLRTLLENKELMQQFAMMEQEESKQNVQEIISLKSYLPSATDLESIRQNLGDIKDIEIHESSSIRNFEGKFEIDRFRFSIQFMIFPKSFIHCWIGFIGTVSPNVSRSAAMTMPHSGGIGGQQMGGPVMSMNAHPDQVIKEHYLSNLMISIPHRTPVSDEFGVTNMSSMALINESMDIGNGGSGHPQGMNEENHFKISANDLAMKLSKMLSRSSKSTVQISCDIPSQIINTSIGNTRFQGMRRRMDDMERMEEDSMLIQLERKVLSVFKEMQSE